MQAVKYVMLFLAIAAAGSPARGDSITFLNPDDALNQRPAKVDAYFKNEIFVPGLDYQRHYSLQSNKSPGNSPRAYQVDFNGATVVPLPTSVLSGATLFVAIVGWQLMQRRRMA